jgi:tRNAThr (cytosine32-N3)-methyltransferase
MESPTIPTEVLTTPVLDHPPKASRKQLSSAMEHMRSVVTLPSSEEPTTYGMPGSIQPVRRPRTDSSANPQKRSDPFQFGSRYLEEGDDIFAYNAWDHVETDDTYKDFAEEQYCRQREMPVSDANKKKYNEHPERWWNKFYANNTSNFFKNRKWLHQEFPVLTERTGEDAGETVILEVGAGAGNTAFPIMALNKNPRLRLHACDFSKKAVEVIQSNPAYTSEETVGDITASVWDVASPPDAQSGDPTIPEGIEAGTVDIVILIFIFSALAPSQWSQAVANIWHVLKPGGVILFRDYGRGDLSQVRFKKERYMDENFYARGDGTRVYFFAEDELRQLWAGEDIEEAAAGGAQETVEADLFEKKMESLSVLNSSKPKFEVVNLGVDRRMLVNRQRKLKMYRCWMQAKFRKPVDLTTLRSIAAL